MRPLHRLDFRRRAADKFGVTRRTGWRVFWGVVVTLAFVQWGLPRWQAHLETLGAWEVKEGPIVATDTGGVPLLATLVVQQRINWHRPTRRSYADDQILELQLNQPDGRDAGRVFVLRSETSGVLNLGFLGTTPGRVWIFAEGLRGVNLATRTLDVDPTILAGRIPALADQLSDDGRHYALDAQGTVTMVTRDGRRVALRLQDWTIAPAAAPTPMAQAKNAEEYQRQVADYDRRVAEMMGPRAASVAGEFGLDSWRSDGRWIGILSDAEQKEVEPSWSRPRVTQYSHPERRRVWVGDASQRRPDAIALDTFTLADVHPAGDRIYLRGAVLRDGSALRAVTIPGSPDVLVEHYTAVDASAAFRLTRLDPAGEERWTITVPVRFPRTVAAAGDYVVLTGLPPGVADERRMLLVSVRLADGVVATYAYDRRAAG